MEKDDMSLRVDSFSCYLDDTAQRKAINSTSPPIPFTSINMFSKSKDNLANLRVDSLSTYLNSTGDSAATNFVFQIPAGSADPGPTSSAFTFSRELPKDGEIGVFNADRYFNMKLELPKIKYHEEEVRPKPKSPSSSCFSETTSISWNSQTALMPADNNLRIIGPQKAHKSPIGRRIFARLRCKVPCFDKKSLPDFNSERVDSRNRIKIGSLEESRPSIEVFGSSNRVKGDVATKLERKLSMLTWDAIPKGKTVIPAPPSSASVCDDMASEASSDLFEIENISGSATCMSPSSYYAPSEASIQWSVVTASAAGCSALSEFNDETSVGDLILRNNKSVKTKVEGGQRTRAGGILGCKNQSAVDVVCLDTSKHNQGKDLKLPRTLAISGGQSYPSIL